MKLERGQTWRMRLADRPVLVRKIRKTKRCEVCRNECHAGELAGTLALQKRDGPTVRYFQQVLCARCVYRLCDFVRAPEKWTGLEVEDTCGELPF